jgi:hypothetical protein
VKTFLCSIAGILICGSMLLQNAPKRLDDQDDDYAVYSQVIGHEWAREGVKRIVIREDTVMRDQPRPRTGNAQYGKEFYDAVANETRLDYDQKNKSPMVLDGKRFFSKVYVAIISEAEYDRIFSVGLAKNPDSGKLVKGTTGWEEFYQLYPKSQGIMSLSRIGFNPSKTQAIVYVGNECGGLCGIGDFFLLRKESGKWRIQTQLNAWIS